MTERPLANASFEPATFIATTDYSPSSSEYFSRERHLVTVSLHRSPSSECFT